MLHDVLARENVHVGELIIPGRHPARAPTHDPDVLANTLVDHTTKGEFRVVADRMPNRQVPSRAAGMTSESP